MSVNKHGTFFYSWGEVGGGDCGTHENRDMGIAQFQEFDETHRFFTTSCDP
jgi:hypothetical protein